MTKEVEIRMSEVIGETLFEVDHTVGRETASVTMRFPDDKHIIGTFEVGIDEFGDLAALFNRFADEMKKHAELCGK